MPLVRLVCGSASSCRLDAVPLTELRTDSRYPLHHWFLGGIHRSVNLWVMSMLIVRKSNSSVRNRQL